MAQNGSNVDSRYKARHKGKHVATIGAFNWEPMQSGMITIFLLKLLGLKGSSMCLGINRRKVRNYACLREDELQKVFNLSDISENSVPIQFLYGHKIEKFSLLKIFRYLCWPERCRASRRDREAGSRNPPRRIFVTTRTK